jgi:hypothetical protein
MKNGTQSKKLTLVNNVGDEIPIRSSVDEVSAEYDSAGTDSEGQTSSQWDDPLHNRVLFAAVSIACATAAIAAGSYAIYLSRRKVATKALTNVQELLDTCQQRMTDLDREMNSISRLRPASA